MTAYKLREILLHIYKSVYMDDNVQSFYIDFKPKELTSKNGDYDCKTKRISIYNFSRPPQYIVVTAIHEFTHHIVYTRDGNRNHDKEFYREFKKLLSASVALGYVNYEEVRKKNDSKDILVMEKKLGPVMESYDSLNDVNSKYRTVRVLNGYEIKEQLKKWQFNYSTMEQYWEKDVTVEEAAYLKGEIEMISTSAEVEVRWINDLSIDVLYLLVVRGNTYAIRDILKKRKYVYKGEGCWQKRVLARDIQVEKEYLDNFKYIEVRQYGLN